MAQPGHSSGVTPKRSSFPGSGHYLRFCSTSGRVRSSGLRTRSATRDDGGRVAMGSLGARKRAQGRRKNGKPRRRRRPPATTRSLRVGGRACGQFVYEQSYNVVCLALRWKTRLRRFRSVQVPQKNCGRPDEHCLRRLGFYHSETRGDQGGASSREWLGAAGAFQARGSSRRTPSASSYSCDIRLLRNITLCLYRDGICRGLDAQDSG